MCFYHVPRLYRHPVALQVSNCQPWVSTISAAYLSCSTAIRRDSRSLDVFAFVNCTVVALSIFHSIVSMLGLIFLQLWTALTQAYNQLGTPRGGEEFSVGVQFFKTMSNAFFQEGPKNFQGNSPSLCPVAYAENFHWRGGSFSGIGWSFEYGERCLWRHNLTSYSCFQINILAKFVNRIGIFFYTQSPSFCKNSSSIHSPYNKVFVIYQAQG